MTNNINPSESREQDHQTAKLTESELAKVTGGSQSSGAGAGKVKFNSFQISRKVDAASPKFFTWESRRLAS
jgi:bacteriocin-like protein